MGVSFRALFASSHSVLSTENIGSEKFNRYERKFAQPLLSSTSSVHITLLTIVYCNEGGIHLLDLTFGDLCLN